MAQHVVARVLAERVVDILEPVDIDAQHAEPPGPDRVAHLRGGEMRGQTPASGEPGEVVVIGGGAGLVRPPPRRGLAADLFGHVAAGDDHLAIPLTGAGIDERKALPHPEVLPSRRRWRPRWSRRNSPPSGS